MLIKNRPLEQQGQLSLLVFRYLRILSLRADGHPGDQVSKAEHKRRVRVIALDSILRVNVVHPLRDEGDIPAANLPDVVHRRTDTGPFTAETTQYRAVAGITAHLLVEIPVDADGKRLGEELIQHKVNVDLVTRLVVRIVVLAVVPVANDHRVVATRLLIEIGGGEVGLEGPVIHTGICKVVHVVFTDGCHQVVAPGPMELAAVPVQDRGQG